MSLERTVAQVMRAESLLEIIKESKVNDSLSFPGLVIDNRPGRQQLLPTSLLFNRYNQVISLFEISFFEKYFSVLFVFWWLYDIGPLKWLTDSRR